MAKALTIDRFRRGETVRTLDPLPGVPEGTPGRVTLVDGFAWVRYRVLFDNGVDVGTLDGTALARPKQYDEALALRTAASQAHAEVAEADGDTEAAATGGGEAKSVNGVSVPSHLLERSKQARQRLGA